MCIISNVWFRTDECGNTVIASVPKHHKDNYAYDYVLAQVEFTSIFIIARTLLLKHIMLTESGLGGESRILDHNEEDRKLLGQKGGKKKDRMDSKHEEMRRRNGNAFE